MSPGPTKRNRIGENVDNGDFDPPSIMEAVEYNDIDMASRALSAKPETLNHLKDGLTPLHLAVSRGNLSMVEYLTSQEGIDLFLKDKLERTPLELALHIGHPKVKDLLFQRVAEHLDLGPKGPTLVVP